MDSEVTSSEVTNGETTPIARRDTCRRIQEVALRLFSEHGYEATSLREIAEQLGVSKAALYYHFKSKDDILHSLIAERHAVIEELIAWAKTLPRTAESRRQILTRYSEILHEPKHQAIIRFFERNQASAASKPNTAKMRDKMSELVAALSGPDDPPTVLLKRSLALFTLHAYRWALQDPTFTDEEREKVALEVALELADACDNHPSDERTRPADHHSRPRR